MTDTPTVPAQDHSGGGDEATLFADVLANSALINAEVPPSENDSGESLDDSADADLEEADDSTDYEDDDEDDGALLDEDSDDDDDSLEEDSTEDDELEDDSDDGEVDWDFEVPVKIDGEEGTVTLEELRKGYQTQQHLSKQGRELGEAKAAFEAERTEKMEQVTSTAEVLATQVKKAETELATEYGELKAKHAELKKEGDRYGAEDVKDKMTDVQERYWQAVRDREALEKNVAAAREQAQTEAFEAEVKRFGEEIDQYIPDFDTDRAKLIRDFAIAEGLPEELINVIASAPAIKFIDDYRQMKESLNKGSAKRKKLPKRKVRPTRKATPATQKKQKKDQVLSKKIASGEATEEEGMDFLRGLTQKYV